jgi:2-polyprenyl-3-methyl-5-hydroxy-6-metoxy-1,4-benzoquinol methylase
MQWLRSQRDVLHAAGMEISPEAAAKARGTFDLVLTGNAETMDMPAGSFDLVIILDVLEHLVDPWRMVQRIQAALAPGGSIIASIPNVGHYSVCSGLLRGKWDYGDFGLLDRTHLRFFTEKTAMGLMTRDGLTVQQIDRTFLDPLSARWTSKKLHWYIRKVIGAAVPSHLTTYQFLIRSAVG